MIKVAIVYHTGYGHTGRQAEAVQRGVELEGVEVKLISVDDLNGEASEELWAYLDEAHAHIWGSPTYMGGVSAPFKTFIDATSKPWASQAWKDKLCAGFTNSANPSGDKLNTLLQLAVLAGQQGMMWVSLGLLAPGKPGGDVEDVNRLGSYLGAMAQSPQDEQDPAKSPLPGDLKTSEILGQRVAQAAKRWNSGQAA